MPEYWANKLLGINHDYSGWMVHLQWLGGYWFQPHWYGDLTKWLFFNPPPILVSIVMFITMLVAVYIKIKVTGILFESGYLSETDENKFETQKTLSTVEARYLANEPFENIEFISPILNRKQPELVSQKN